LPIFSHPTWDIVLFLCLMAMGFFIGVSRGKKNIVVALIALYMDLVIFPILPIETLPVSGKNYFIVGIFFMIFILLSFLLRRVLKSTGEEGWWRIFVLSFLLAAFIFAAFFVIAPKEIIVQNTWGFSPLTIKIFLNSSYAKYWLILPLLGILFF